MSTKQIKDEIRKLSRIEKTDIYKWIDEEAAGDLLSRIGVNRLRRSPKNRMEPQGDHREKHVHIRFFQ
jgi:hypothetical protein